MTRLLLPVFFLFSGLCIGKTFTIPVGTDYYDAKKAGVSAGDTICLQEGERKYLQIKNISGDSLNPVIIKSCGGRVVIQNSDFRYGLMINNSRYFRLTGISPEDSLSIKVLGTGPGASGVSVGDKSSNFEIDHLEIANAGFAGIMAKTDPRCDSSANRGIFLMRDVSIHDNYIHDVGGEGIYAGNSFYSGWTANKQCTGDTLYPHKITGIKIYRNIIENSGWDGLQLGCATEDAEISDNIIKNFGVADIEVQNNGIQVGEGTTGIVARNVVENGPGNGIIMLGLGNNLVFDNLISETKAAGIFCDDRVTIDSSVVAIFNNTFKNTGEYAVILYNEKTKNYIFNNVILAEDSISNVLMCFDNVGVVEENNVLEVLPSGEDFLNVDYGASLSPSEYIPDDVLSRVRLPVCGVNFLRKQR